VSFPSSAHRVLGCIVVVGFIVYHYCLRFDREVVCIVVVGYVVYHYSLRFDREVQTTPLLNRKQ
jgi:hypothetical protein